MAVVVQACSVPVESPKPTVDAGPEADAQQSQRAQCLSDNDCGASAVACLKRVCKAGQCGVAPQDNGSKCDDGNACTTGDVCDDGQCVGSGQCQCLTKSDCAAFEDGDLCNGVLYCALGTHTCLVDPSTVSECDASVSAKCTVEKCQLKTGACKAEAAGAGSKCDDGHSCTSDDTCIGGGCVGKPAAGAKVCDDANACTDDGCVAAGGCVNLPMKATCEDNDLCTDNYCEPASGCVALPMKATCDDGDSCTLDTCEPAKGCVNMPVQTTCTN